MLNRLTVAFLMIVAIAQAEPIIVKNWEFKTPDDFKGWSTDQLENVRIQDGCLQGSVVGSDGKISSPFFPAFKAKASDIVEIVMQTTFENNGKAQLYWAKNPNTRYGGFDGKQILYFKQRSGDQFETYKLEPCWQADGQVIRLRLDFPPLLKTEETTRNFKLKSIRIIDPNYKTVEAENTTWHFKDNANPDWTPGVDEVGCKTFRLNEQFFDTDKAGYNAAVKLVAKNTKKAKLGWNSSWRRGWNEMEFNVFDDGKPHMYNVNVLASTGWAGQISQLTLTAGDNPDASVEVISVIVCDETVGDPELRIKHAGLSNALNRVGRPCKFHILLENIGGAINKDSKIVRLDLPEGVKVVGTEWQKICKIEPFEYDFAELELIADRPLKGQFQLEIATPGAAYSATASGTLEFTPSLNLPKADYVPVPQPVDTGKYEVGAFYFPGWDNSANGGWPRIWRTSPERKPMLGWYDEGNPECIDWHIKWLVENGIKYLWVDWYWHEGAQNLDHWVKGFQKCRYKSYLKWAVMWANHNAPGSHSEDDQRQVVKWWIENYFNTPEYYTVDGMPAVMIWSPEGMERDMKGKGGVKRLNDIIQEMAKAAGYKGVHISVIKRPEWSADPEIIGSLRDRGFHSTSMYRYRHHANKAKDTKNFPFTILADTSMEVWEARHKTGMIPFYVNITTGWDDLPWRNTCRITGRSPILFEKICRDAKSFADKYGLEKWLQLGPVNEWGEGSYAEPNAEFGFAMYEAVRNTFAKKPEGGWPINYGPEDVGLGPYDLKVSEIHLLKDWQFDGKHNAWKPSSRFGKPVFANGTMTVTSNHDDPQIGLETKPFLASDYKRICVRLKIQKHPEGKEEFAEVFWSMAGIPLAQALSQKVEYTATGDWQTFVFDLENHPRWRGKITYLRLDPFNRPDTRCEIDRIWLE